LTECPATSDSGAFARPPAINTASILPNYNARAHPAEWDFSPNFPLSQQELLHSHRTLSVGETIRW